MLTPSISLQRPYGAALSRRVVRSCTFVVQSSLRRFSTPSLGTSKLQSIYTARAQQLASKGPSLLNQTVDLPQPDVSNGRVAFHGVHHVALICENLESSLAFYQGVLGLEVNPDRPHDKLPYRGAWLWIGPEMIHLMELPNPDPTSARPEHGGRDRHFAVGVQSIQPLEAKLETAGVAFTRSASGRPAIFFRDPDMNCLECIEGLPPWR